VIGVRERASRFEPSNHNESPDTTTVMNGAGQREEHEHEQWEEGRRDRSWMRRVNNIQTRWMNSRQRRRRRMGKWTHLDIAAYNLLMMKLMIVKMALHSDYCHSLAAASCHFPSLRLGPSLVAAGDVAAIVVVVVVEVCRDF